MRERERERERTYLEIDDSKTPVHAQVNRNKNEIVGKKINFFGPAF